MGGCPLRGLLTTGILQDLEICILSSSHYVSAYSRDIFVFAFKICLRHQSVTPFLSGQTSPKKNSGSALELSLSKGGHVQTFWTLRVEAYSRLGSFEFSLLSARAASLFSTKRKDVTKQGFCKIL